jgi:hypothetical protein
MTADSKIKLINDSNKDNTQTKGRNREGSEVDVPASLLDELHRAELSKE